MSERALPFVEAGRAADAGSVRRGAAGTTESADAQSVGSEARTPGAVWAYVIFMAALAGFSVLAVTYVRAAPIGPWYDCFFIGAAIAVLALLPVALHVGRQTWRLELTGVPILVGAVLVKPEYLVLTVLVSNLVVLLPQRETVVRLSFNIANQVVAASACVAVLHTLTHGSSPASALWWPGIAAAAVVLNLVAIVGLSGVLKCNRVDLGAHYVSQLMAQLVVTPLAEIALAVVGIACYRGEPFALLVLAGPVLLLGWWYRSSERLGARFRDLQSLYSFSKSLADVTERDDVLSVALNETRSVLHCETAELCVAQPDGLVRFRLDGAGRLTEEVATSSAPEATVLATQAALHLSPSSHHPYLLDRQFKDAMFVPLSVGGDRSSVLVAGDRHGDASSTFSREDLDFFQALAAHLSTALTSSNHLDHLRRSVAEREHQAYHDGLTGLANRTLFMNVVAKALENSGGNRMVAVVLMDLDGFKEINDALGHHTGDEVLKVVAQRVSTGVREYGLAARLGGDEYAFMVAAASSVDEVISITEKLMASVGAPMEIENVALTVRASVGIALAPVHGLDANTLLKKADVAMYAAKSSARRINVYDRSMDNSSSRRLALATDLGKAIDHDELDLWFQPVADIASGRVAGFEALLRWPHAALGFIPPDEFIPIAEQTGLIEPLTWWVVHQALSELKRWRDDGYDFDMAVNMSVRSLLDAAMVDRLRDMVASFDLTPNNVTLEITESSMMVELERSEAALRRLSDMGFKIAIDDFGTGYSSLSRLKVLPVHVVKIDRAFIKNITFDKGDQAIVKSIIDLARVMGHQIVAEGIEDLQTWSRLASLGCDLGQGYYFARPMLARDCRRWVLDRQGPSIAAVRSLGLRRIEGA